MHERNPVNFSNFFCSSRVARVQNWCPLQPVHNSLTTTTLTPDRQSVGKSLQRQTEEERWAGIIEQRRGGAGGAFSRVEYRKCHSYLHTREKSPTILDAAPQEPTSYREQDRREKETAAPEQTGILVHSQHTISHVKLLSDSVTTTTGPVKTDTLTFVSSSNLLCHLETVT